jgi:hypothetical protein
MRVVHTWRILKYLTRGIVTAGPGLACNTATTHQISTILSAVRGMVTLTAAAIVRVDPGTVKGGSIKVMTALGVSVRAPGGQVQ